MGDRIPGDTFIGGTTVSDLQEKATQKRVLQGLAMALSWQQKKRIGEALGYKPEHDQIWAWDAYQPDVLGEVIPWLEKHVHEWGAPWRAGEYSPWYWTPLVEEARYLPHCEHFPEAVCALMLAILEATDDR